MQIGVISDTHDRIECLEKIAEIFTKNKVEMIVHCGDWVSPFMIDYFDEVFNDHQVPTKSIVGNNPGDLERMVQRNNQLRNPIDFVLKDRTEFEIDDRKILVIHGGDKEALNRAIQNTQYDAIFTGHTHAARNEYFGKMLVLNSGSTSFVCESKPINTASVAIYDSGDNKAKIIEFSKKDVYCKNY